MIYSLIPCIIIGVLLVIFIAQNVAPVVVLFFGWQFGSSLAVMLILAVLSGVVITLSFLIPSFIKDAAYIRKMKRKQESLEKDLDDARRVLKDIPFIPGG
ncbi:MAG: LapA family protein [Minisyncoccia bacterium]